LPSIDEFLPIGEASLPHALAWDEIPTSLFDGQPLDTRILQPLREASVARQAKLEEFLYLRKNIDWFKARQDQKTVSLNLDARKKQKESDEAFKKAMDAEKKELARNEFPYREFRVAPAPQPKLKAPKKPDAAANPDEEEDASELSTDNNDAYAKVDVFLRESLRVVNDAIALGKDKQFAADVHAPLAIADRKG
ncbi:MAG TPA: carboxy terminal-processing peptidase, partial [Opitutaceae bacterium]|nr:carboxy terminal-processing peptidase [Opitutaceae bacterium]